MKKRKRTRIKWINLLLLITIIICASIFLLSSIQIIKWTIDNKNTDSQTNKITEITKIKEIEDNENTEIVNNEIVIDKNAPYWNFIKMNMIDADFNEIKKINKDVKGWIEVNGTTINYPYVQTNNNNFYLNHTFDKTSNGAGWIFLDYRNDTNFEDKNTIIYGHGRSNSSMFGSLKNITKSSWFNNTNNYVIKIATEKSNTLWEVFSVYHIPTTSDYLQISFNSDDEFLDFVNKLKERSYHKFNTSIFKTDKIITLSTCFNDDEKVVMHARLIKIQNKNA